MTTRKMRISTRQIELVLSAVMGFILANGMDSPEIAGEDGLVGFMGEITPESLGGHSFETYLAKYRGEI
jgi:hypothetical protein